jgi:hypothetical protein
MCRNEELKKKNSKYNLANEKINLGTDYLEMIKLNKDFKVLKYLLLNNVQQKTFDFLSNLKIGQDKWYDTREYPEIFKSKDSYETMKIIKKYYERQNESSNIDNKLFSLIHPKVKKILEEID